MWSLNDKVWSPKWENEESNFVKIWNYWRILRKLAPLRLKMSSASGGLCAPYPLPGSSRTLPTGASPLDPTGDFRPQTTSFVQSPKILKLYYATKTVVLHCSALVCVTRRWLMLTKRTPTRFPSRHLARKRNAFERRNYSGYLMFSNLYTLHIFTYYCNSFPSVLWHCWLGDRKGIRPVEKTWSWFVGGNEWFDWSFAQAIAPVVAFHHPLLQ